ncbi:dynamin family protein [Paenibacillus sp. FSL W8-0194]|uniref:dynamin family protein n=1 Tax=Paenibacillus sp. FSL W8-0194 TaxID=2921711 RepID=UPI0030DABA61
MESFKQNYLRKMELIKNALTENIQAAKAWQMELSEFVDLTDAIQSLEKIKDNFEVSRFELVVVGEFSTGKSTFINALIGKKVLPSKAMPTTATVNFIRHIRENPNHKEEVIVHFENETTQTVEFTNLEEFVTEMSQSHSVVDDIRYVDVFVDSHYLEGGVVIVDTPGMKSLHRKHDEITHAQIRRSNASIFLFNINQAGSRTEYEFLQKVKESINRIFFVANRCDEVNEEDQSIMDVIQSIEEKLRNNDYYQVEEHQAIVYPVSSQQALLSRDNTLMHGRNGMSNQELFEKSRFQVFEHRLWEYLTKGEKAQEQLEDPLHRIVLFFESISKKLAERLNILSGEVNVEELQEKIRIIQESIETRKLKLANDKEEIHSFAIEIRDNQRSKFNEEVETLKQDLIRTCANFEDLDEYNESFGQTEAYIHSRFYDYIHQNANQLRLSVMNLVMKKLKADKDEFEGIFNFPIDQFQIETRLKQKKRKPNEELLAIKGDIQEIQDNLINKKNDAVEAEQRLESVQINQEIERQIEREEEMYRQQYQMINGTIANISGIYTDYETPEWRGLGKVLGWIGFERKQRSVNRKDDTKEQMIKKQEQLEEQFQEKLQKLESRKDSTVTGTVGLSQQRLEKIERDIEELKNNYRKAREKLLEKKIEASKQEMVSINKDVTRMIEDSAAKVVRSYQQIMAEINIDSIIDHFFDSYLEESDETIRLLHEELASSERLVNENEEKKRMIKEKMEQIEGLVQTKKAQFEGLLEQLKEREEVLVP